MNDTAIEDFYKTMHRLHRCKPTFKKHGELSNVEFFILMEIAGLVEGREDGITLKELIDHTDMTMSAASKKVSILEKKGLVNRAVSPKDKRNISITLTPDGKKLCEEERQKKHDWMENILFRMGEKDARQMFVLFNKMLDIIEEIEKEGDGADV